MPADRTLLDVLVDAGIEARLDCKRGECGLWFMDIVSAHGTIDHRSIRLAQRLIFRAASPKSVRYIYARAHLSIQPRKTETP